MKKTLVVLVLVLCSSLVVGVVGCGTAETATTTTVSLTTTISSTTTTTEPPPNWTKLEPAGEVPSARCYHSMIYDSSTGKVVMLGGFDGTLFLSETWAYDPVANAWSNLNPAGEEAPSLGGQIPMVYDSGTGKVIAYDGRTWAYDAAANAWTDLDPDGDEPPVRLGSSMVRDGATGKVILFGGTDMAIGLNDLWAYDPAANTWTGLEPTGDVPPGRSGACMVYDPTSAKIILFGGMDPAFVCFNDTWTYDSAANTWTKLTPASDLPRARTGHVMVYDPHSSMVVLFGGMDSEFACFNDTWNYDPVANAWTELFPAGDWPPMRGRTSLVYVEEIEKMILFGGSAFEAALGAEFPTESYFNDMWSYGVNP
jgi:hypothetical protein